MDKKREYAPFLWKITYAHVIAYFVAGLFAMTVMNYRELFTTDALSLFMKPTTEPIVALGGTTLQLFRGVLLALIIYPLRKAFFEDRHGYLKLSLAVFGLSFLVTIGPAPGSFEGFIYTTIPVPYQLLSYPEALIYTFLFVGILYISHKFDKNKAIKILPVVFVCLIALIGVMGYLFA